MKKITSLVLASSAAMLGLARAATISISATAPTVDGADIAMLNPVGQYDIGGNQGHIWANRPVQGQAFTTGPNAGGYQLNAVTLQNLNNNVSNSPTFTLRVGSVVGSAFTSVGGESGVPAAYTPLDFLTFVLDTPITLEANTLYGFDWGSNGSGFVTVNNADSNYLGGSAYSSGANGVGAGAITLHTGAGAGTGDRIFHLDIDAVPEPSTALLGLAGLALALRRRR